MGHYNPLTERVRDALLAGEAPEDLMQEFGDKETGRSLAILSTFEPPEQREALFGKPASDLKILCDVNFSYALTLPIYENIGAPHYTFSQRFKDQFMLESAGIGEIRPNSSDVDLYAYARDNSYDAILSCDRNLSGSKDLCWIARDSFSKRNADDPLIPTIAILKPGDEAGAVFLEQYGSRIIDSIEKRDKPFVDFLVEPRQAEEAIEADQPGAWLKNYLAQRNEPEP
ncbi:MAG: hypothetical protein ACRBCK_00470 [Alphaproteobacteria bacterium]